MNKAISLLEQLRELNDKPQAVWSALAEISELLNYDLEASLSELYEVRKQLDTAPANAG